LCSQQVHVVESCSLTVALVLSQIFCESRLRSRCVFRMNWSPAQNSSTSRGRGKSQWRDWESGAPSA
jgi:hypothetical protein